jgi:hypothetical protein
MGAGPLRRCFDYYIRVMIALFDPLYERIVYLTNSLVDEGKLMAFVDANIYKQYDVTPHA